MNMSSRTPFQFLVLFALLPWLATAQGTGLPDSVTRALTQSGIPISSVAIWAHPVDAKAPLLSVNADQPMNPASVMKLVTAFAALERFGPVHTWTTRIAHDGALENGRLKGNLYIVGGGDPVLSYERVWKLLRRVREMGVRHVEGDIVLDGSVLRLPPHDPFAFDGRGLRPYNSGPSGMLLHFNTLQLFLRPGARHGDPVSVVSSPPIHGLRIDNRLVTESGACGVWHRGLDATVESTPDGPRLALIGNLPASCGEQNWSAAPFSPDQFGTALISGVWEEVGGELRGLVRGGTTPMDARPLLSDNSPSLAEVVREMNKWSSNVIARQMVAMLGASNPGAPDMVAEGRLVATAKLAAAGINTGGLVIENGSGLSRIERIRADSLGTMLLTAWQRPYMPEFISALPLAGMDGTAHRRLRGSEARGQAHIKTGTINNVRAIAGYMLDRNGRRHVVVMMVNHARAAESQAAQDALLEWLWEGR